MMLLKTRPARIAAFLSLLLVLFFSAPAHASQWDILPGVTLGVLAKNGADIKSSDTERLDGGLLVVTTVLQDAKNTYRCVEYVTEFQFEMVRAACFKALAPQN